MRIATAIITAPRPRATIAESIVSYRHAGFLNSTRTMIFSDHVSPPINLSCVDEVIVNSVRLGNLRNWAKALRLLYTRGDEDWLMVCEDDITWAANAAADLMRDLESLAASRRFETAGGFSLYCPINISRNLEQQSNGRLAEGWHRGPRKGLKTWGAQCFVFSRKQAHRLIEDRQFASFLASPKWDKNVDGIVAKCVEDLGFDLFYRIPCLVNHDLGDANSSLGYRDHRPTLKSDYFQMSAT
jgi:hypothetical protein